MSDVMWGPTLVLNHIRAACAGVVWFILFLFLPSDSGSSNPAIFLSLPFVYLLGMLPIALISYGLSKMGVPFIGLMSVMMSILLIPGDPVTYIIHKYAPRFVPVERYKILNFATVLLVKKNQMLTAM